MDTLLEVQGLKKVYRRKGLKKRESFYAVNDVSFTVGRSETVGIVGESGCGKTTLGRSILRLIEPDAGHLIFDGTDVLALKKNELRRFRKRMQIVFQDSSATLDPRWKIGKTLVEALQAHNTELSNAQALAEAAHLLEIAGLSTQQKDKFPHELSGGQKQRIGIAKALATRPELIVADEPVSALDVSVQAQILNLLKELQPAYNLSYLFISHDLSVVRFMSDRVCVMYLGQIVEMADNQQFFDNTLHPYSLALLAAVPQPNPAKKNLSPAVTAALPAAPAQGCPYQNKCSLATQTCRAQRPPLRQAAPGHYVACYHV